MIEALYEASQAGVRVDLVIRGISCLRAGVEGLSENIRVRSILGRYLEHSRIYRFAHGDVDDQPLYLIGSADLMPRNLDRRVEVLVPIEHPKHRDWLDQVFEFLLADDIVRWELQPDDSWERCGPPDAFEPHAQERLYRWVVERQPRPASSRRPATSHAASSIGRAPARSPLPFTWPCLRRSPAVPTFAVGAPGSTLTRLHGATNGVQQREHPLLAPQGPRRLRRDADPGRLWRRRRRRRGADTTDAGGTDTTQAVRPERRPGAGGDTTAGETSARQDNGEAARRRGRARRR